MNKKLLDVETGAFLFSDQFKVDTATTKSELVNYFGVEQVDISDMGNEWAHYTVRNIEVSGIHFIFTFYYQNESLNRIDIMTKKNGFRRRMLG